MLHGGKWRAAAWSPATFTLAYGPNFATVAGVIYFLATKSVEVEGEVVERYVVAAFDLATEMCSDSGSGEQLIVQQHRRRETNSLL
jgi:hypothetical protein